LITHCGVETVTIFCLCNCASVGLYGTFIVVSVSNASASTTVAQALLFKVQGVFVFTTAIS
jgi:hypothetical protein